MRTKTFITIVAAALMVCSGTTVWGQSGVTSKRVGKGGVNIPRQITAYRVEIAPGGETGRHKHPVPTFVYVLEGILTVYTEVSAEHQAEVGYKSGTQYYSAGQSYVVPGGYWHNHYNRESRPLKYLVVYFGEKGKPNIIRPEQAAAR
jgi:quercetin dioxygenase-like cupin family protein